MGLLLLEVPQPPLHQAHPQALHAQVPSALAPHLQLLLVLAVICMVCYALDHCHIQ